MRLTKYTVEFDEARKPILAKERSFNYSAAEQLNEKSNPPAMLGRME